MSKNELLPLVQLRTNYYKSGLDDNEQIILNSYLFLLKKEGILNNDFSIPEGSTLSESLAEIIKEFKSEGLTNLFYDHIESICKNGRKLYLKAVSETFARLELEAYKDNLAGFFDDHILRPYISKSSGDYTTMQLTELTTLLNHFLPDNREISYYNPFAGLGSLALNLNNNVNYYGEEINETNWILGKIRMLVYKLPHNFKYTLADSIMGFKFQKKYDYIAFNPPFNLKLFQAEYEELFKTNDYGYKNNATSLIISECFKKLENNGTLACVIPSNFLSSNNSTDKSLKKFLVDGYYIDCVIALPERLLNFTSIQVNIMILKKSRGALIRLVDASSFVDNQEGKTNKLDIAKVLSEISSSNSKFSRLVTSEEIAEFNYNLNVKRYFLEEQDGVLLGTLASIVISTSEINSLLQKFGPNPNGKLINIVDLKSNPFDYNLNLDNIKSAKIPKKSNILRQSVLLLALKGNHLKPTYYKYTRNNPLSDFGDKECFVSKDIVTLIIKESKIDVEFLIHELHSDYVIKQLKAMRGGSALPYLKHEDLLKIKIKVPSILEQRAKVAGAKKAYYDALKRENQLKEKMVGFKEQSDKNLKSIFHTMRQYLNSLKTNIGGTTEFIQKNTENGISLETMYSRNLNRTFGEHLKSLDKTINSMSLLLDSYENNVDDTETKILHLKTIVEESQIRFKNPNKFKFEPLYLDLDAFVFDEGYLDQFIEFNEEDFYKVFSNIVHNALNHGFTKSSVDYRIKTGIFNNPEKEEFVLEISNNGEEFPVGFTYDDLITHGEKSVTSTGTGMGGKDIKDILEKYNAYFELIINKDEEFSVKYILHFPKKTLIDLVYSKDR